MATLHEMLKKNETYKVCYDRFNTWIASDEVDVAGKAELISLYSKDIDELVLRFGSYLSFGTAGLRGKMGAGTNMMNVYTVAQATQGLADFIISEGKSDRSVVVGYDSRNNSKLFAEMSACVLAANGIHVWLFPNIQPTPELSFAVREKNCIAGINITASHNPKEYNGYKAYWEDGAQLSLTQADAVAEKIRKVDVLKGAKKMPLAEAVAAGKITYLDAEFDAVYLAKVKAEAVNPDCIKKVADDLTIVYTPLHGTGYQLVPRVLAEVGFRHIYPVEEQMIPDGNFPTVAKPNPEYPAVFKLGIELANKVHSDLIVANDPDADRTGIMARNKNGEFECLTGNQVGALLLDYIITAYEETSTMPELPYAVKTIVTTEIITEIGRQHNVEIFNVLTGFKFIGEVIKKHEEAGKGHYLFGFEESYGYLKGTYARDKDSVVASMLICEMAAYYFAKSMTLCDALAALYERYGYYREGNAECYMEGVDGAERMKKLMNKLRTNPPKELAGHTIVEIRDYLNETSDDAEGVITDLVTGEIKPTGLPSSNVLYYRTDAGDVVVVRPSGTEPKIKFYILAHDENIAAADEKVKAYSVVTAAWKDMNLD